MIALGDRRADCRIHISDDGTKPRCHSRPDSMGYNLVTAPNIWNWAKQVCPACDTSRETEAYLRGINTNRAQEQLAEAVAYFGREHGTEP